MRLRACPALTVRVGVAAGRAMHPLQCRHASRDLELQNSRTHQFAAAAVAPPPAATLAEYHVTQRCARPRAAAAGRAGLIAPEANSLAHRGRRCLPAVYGVRKTSVSSPY